MTRTKLLSIASNFRIPLTVLAGLILYCILELMHASQAAIILAFCLIALGSYQTFRASVSDLLHGQFGVDYIAMLAVITTIITHEYLVGIVIALMLTTGQTLEEYAAKLAKTSLTSLADRIPHEVLVEKNGKTEQVSIQNIRVGDTIIVRKGEVVALDGTLLSENGVLDESSLTGEAYPVDKISGDTIRSGTINLGSPMNIQVTKEEKSSSYTKIINLVRKAQQEKAPMVRLADRYSMWFTVITLVIAAIAFYFNHTLESILAVLVVATPCPLILATPIALMGGMNNAARNHVIIKRLASIEALARVNAIIFDKTGTITLGKPRVSEFIIHEQSHAPDKLTAIAEALERNSLHPLAKAVVRYAEQKKSKPVHATRIHEIIGKGISGNVDGVTYLLSRIPNAESGDMAIGMYRDNKLLGTFYFEDEVKKESQAIFHKLRNMGIHLAIFTGDKREVAERLIKRLGLAVDLKAEAKPEDKQAGIEALKKQGKVTAMVGDGINDAPALAFADIGMVFSNEEHTAASEAADVVFLAGNFSIVLQTVLRAKRTITIAKESILWGIGLSILCMIFAAFGLIPPLAGAIIQECIDVAVIINALRASR